MGAFTKHCAMGKLSGDHSLQGGIPIGVKASNLLQGNCVLGGVLGGVSQS